MKGKTFCTHSFFFLIVPFFRNIFPLWCSQLLLKPFCAAHTQVDMKGTFILCAELYKSTSCECIYSLNHSLLKKILRSISNVPDIILGTGNTRWQDSYPTKLTFLGLPLTLLPLPPGGHRLAAHFCSFRLLHNSACYSWESQLSCLLSSQLSS